MKTPSAASDPATRTVPPEFPPDIDKGGNTLLDFAHSGYELQCEIGRGGMGVVYRARDIGLNREVAIKILQEKYAPGSGKAVRFLEEAQITGQLQHPGIPAVYRVSQLPDGRPFLAMKLIKGHTLDQLLKTGASLDRFAVFEAIAQAVGYAHAHGVIHRDLKPQNVMIGAFGEVQVLDWGLAKVLGTDARESIAEIGSDATAAYTEIRTARDSDTPYTQYGSALGTPAFMSPEQAAGELDKIDTRSDVFGLGAILCVLLTGKPPFDGKDAESIRLNAVRGRIEETMARLDSSGAEADVLALCKRCLAFEPTERPANANDVASAVSDLRRAVAERAAQAERAQHTLEIGAFEERKRRRVRRIAACSVFAALAVGMAISLWQASIARREASDARAARESETLLREAEARQREIAVAHQKEAEAKEAEANTLLNFLEEDLFAKNLPKSEIGSPAAKGLPELTFRETLDASLPGLNKRFAGKPLLEARIRMSLGSAFRASSDGQAALVQYRKALELRNQNLARTDDDRLTSVYVVARALCRVSLPHEALPLCEEYLSITREIGSGNMFTKRLLLEQLLEACRRANDAASCRRAAELWEKYVDETYPDYNRACCRSIAAGIYAKIGQPAEATAEAERAMVWFAKAVAAEFMESRSHVEQDRDLDYIRGREDFKKLLSTLPADPPPVKK